MTIAPADHLRLPRRKPRRLTDEELAIVDTLAALGLKAAQIARQLGRKHRQIAGHLNRQKRRQDGPQEPATASVDTSDGLPGAMTWEDPSAALLRGLGDADMVAGG